MSYNLLTLTDSRESIEDVLMGRIFHRKHSSRNTVSESLGDSSVRVLLLSDFWVCLPYKLVLAVVLVLISISIQSPERQGLILLFCIQIFVFASTFAHLIIAALPDAMTAGAIATIMFSLTMIFNG